MNKFFSIFLLFVPLFGLADWKNDEFSIVGNVQMSDANSSISDSSVQDVGLLVSTTQLNEGWGFKAKHLSQLSNSRTNETHDVYSSLWSLSARAFMSQALNIDVNAEFSDLLKTDGLFRTRNSGVVSEHYIQYSQKLSTKIDLSKDQRFWNVYLAVNYLDTESEYINNMSFDANQKWSADSQFEWQVTEDSYLTSRIEFLHNTQSILRSNTEVTNFYLGFKTKYFGSSLLNLFLGSSTSPDSSDIFSWQASHTTAITDYLSLTILTSRVLQETDDQRFNISNTTNTQLLGSIRFSDVWGGTFSIDHIEQQYEESIGSKRTVSKAGVSFRFSEDWRLAFSYLYDDYTDDRLGFHQNSIQMQLSRDFV